LDKLACFLVLVGARTDESIVTEIATDVGGDNLSVDAVSGNEVLVLAIEGRVASSCHGCGGQSGGKGVRWRRREGRDEGNGRLGRRWKRAKWMKRRPG
jgi:hypothetical protein